MSGTEVHGPTRQAQAWWQLRAQIAAVLWGAIADTGITVHKLADIVEMKPRRVQATLRAEALTLSLGEICALSWALGLRWSVTLEKASGEAHAGKVPATMLAGDA